MKTAVIIFLSAWINISGQTLDKILSEHYSAINIKELADVKTITIKSHLIQGEQKFPVTVYHKRPLNLRAEVVGLNGKSIQIFNGQSGWNIGPSSSNVKKMNENEIAKLKLEADFDGLLFNYLDKGHNIILNGSTEVNGIPAYELNMIKSTGDSIRIFLDARNYLLIRTISSNNITTEVGDYREINGIPFAHSFDSYGSNFALSQRIDTIILNSEIVDSAFVP